MATDLAARSAALREMAKAVKRLLVELTENGYGPTFEDLRRDFDATLVALNATLEPPDDA